VAPDEEELIHVINELEYVLTGHKRLIPPPPDPRIANADPMQRDKLIEAISDKSPGVINVFGPQYSGKTTLMLSAIYGITDLYDVAWVDLMFCDTASDFISMISSALYLGNIHLLEQFEVAFSRFLASLKPGSVIVFDNVDSHDNPQSLRYFEYFLGNESVFMHKFNVTFVVTSTYRPLQVRGLESKVGCVMYNILCKHL
jgi:hypothetical protein